MNTLVQKIQRDFPNIKLEASSSYRWSASDNVVYYATKSDISGEWNLLHETGHATLGHNKFTSDFGLLKQEVDAWAEALKLAKNYNVTIDESYIEDCLDSYRDWLYNRSTCPKCLSACLQIDGAGIYLCHNCDFSWSVSPDRFCRPYRRGVAIDPSAI